MKSNVIPFRQKIAETPAQMSDEALLAACAVGEMSALGLLFDRYHTAVHRFLDGLLGSYRRDLDDVVQATFLEVFRAAGKFHRKSQVKTWILGVASNVARHHTRHETRRSRWVAAFAEQPESTPERPDEIAERRDNQRQLQEALSLLTHEHRVVLVMCDVEGLRGVDVAEALEIPEGTMWRRLHDARKALRVAFSKVVK
jgi:RNA polymerase sigma factor (sigma-70 family)